MTDTARPEGIRVTLTLDSRDGHKGLGEESGSHRSLVLEGTPAEIQAALDELFSAPRANEVRQEFGLKATSASGSSGQQ